MKTLLEHLQALFPKTSRQKLKLMAASGRVVVNSAPVRRLSAVMADDAKVQLLDRVDAVAPTPEVIPGAPASKAPPKPLRVIFEDEDVLVVFKPAGLLTSTTPNEPRPTLLKMVRDYLGPNPGGRQPQRLGLIHRLDRDARGLLVFSKTSRAYISLKQQFKVHSVDRAYLAMVQGVPNPRQGTMKSLLVELPDGKVRSSRNPEKGESAMAEYQVREFIKDLSLVEVKLLTGRKHQIRAQMSERGWPIVGDRMYRLPEPKPRFGKVTGPAPDHVKKPVTRSVSPHMPRLDAGLLRLVAFRLGFDHPDTGKRMIFQLPVPADMKLPGPATTAPTKGKSSEASDAKDHASEGASAKLDLAKEKAEVSPIKATRKAPHIPKQIPRYKPTRNPKHKPRST